jgi:hypothetical protein
MEDYEYDSEQLSNGEIEKYKYLFRIKIHQIINEFSKWKEMSEEEKDNYECDFSWYLASKYEGRV